MLGTLAAHRPDASRGHRRPVPLPSGAMLWRATRASARSGWCGSVDLLLLRPTGPGAGRRQRLRRARCWRDADWRGVL